MNEPATANQSSDCVIETRGLTKYYGRRVVVNQVDLNVPRGGVFAFLGRNGSGKTTTIRMLLGLEHSTRGAAQVLGCDPASLSPGHRSRIGYLTESHFAYGWMTIAECERFQKGTFPRWDDGLFNAVIDHFGLVRTQKFRDLSRGERAGVCLAMTLAPEPELLVLDDPALGLDPVARRALLEAMLMVTRGTDRTIFFSSHLLDDVERVADQIAIIDRGVLRVHCPAGELSERTAAWIVRFEGPSPELPELSGMLNLSSFPGELRVMAIGTMDENDTLLRQMKNVDVERVPVNLQDAVVSYMDERGQRRSLLQRFRS